MKKNNSKNIAIFTFSLLAMIGTYNAVMINSESHMSAGSNFKRLDEMFGVVTEGRTPAVTTQWSKLSKPAQNVIVNKPVAVESSVVAEAHSQATIQEALELKLVEVINSKKWEKGVQASDFSGNIATNNGIIESLNASLPEGLNIDISFSEMTGNTFEYDLNGEVFTGMMYQVDQGSYMITMTNGPLEGTRLKFAGEAVDAKVEAEQTQAYLAENHNVEIGTFGEEMEAQQAEVTETVSAQTAEAASFNF
ncbi:MAG: hypothetical protein H0V66_01895 [Bdellovibrionales bacterium]|nr:hypothetical protein [Bdellovibrionales bacterium]